MMLLVQFLAVTLTTVLALPAIPAAVPEDYSRSSNNYDLSEQVIVPQKRAALVLDRLLVALQKALHEEGGQGYDMDRDGPRTAPLRISGMDTNDLLPVSKSAVDIEGRILIQQFRRFRLILLFKDAGKALGGAVFYGATSTQ